MKEEKVEDQQDLKNLQLKRFSTHTQVFEYYLTKIGFAAYIEAIGPGKSIFAVDVLVTEGKILRKQCVRLYELMTVYLRFLDWDVGKRHTFTPSEVLEYTTWEHIDNILRLYVMRSIFLQSRLSKYVLNLFEWVDHFVVKEGEKVTQVVET